MWPIIIQALNIKVELLFRVRELLRVNANEGKTIEWTSCYGELKMPKTQ
jgi:hypothetical protein